MRIITGSLKGKQLHCPKGLNIRPTLDRVKESLFNIIGTKVHEATCLDLFSGTGNLGIESLSRGASHCSFVDKHPKSIQTIKNNIQSCRLEQQSKVFSTSALKFLSKESAQKYDLIFADPPYDFPQMELLLEKIGENSFLDQEGWFLLEHDKKVVFREEYGVLKLKDQRSYSRTTTSIWSLKKD